MDKPRIKEFFFLLRNSPEYLGMLVVTTFFSIGILIGKYIEAKGGL